MLMRFVLFTFLVVLVACNTRSVVNTAQATLDKKSEPYEHLSWQRAWPDAVFDYNGWHKTLTHIRQETAAAARSGNPCDQQQNNTAWTLQGPANVAGRVNTLALHPQNDDILLAGFSGGGLFKTTDAGLNWNPVFDDQPELSIGDITYDPQNPETVYAGTGDPNMPSTVFNGQGLFRSLDGGDTWHYLALQSVGIISKVVVDPTNSQNLFVASMGNPYIRDNARGVHKSTDGGLTWTHSLFVSNQAGASDLLINPQNPNILYASFWDRLRSNKESIVYGPHARVYKTTDGGQSWTQLGGGLPAGSMGRTGLAMSAQNPDKLYAIYVDTFSRPGGLYRTVDGGDTWTSMNIAGLNNAYVDFGWYFGKVRVSPVNDEDVYVPAVTLWRKNAGNSGWQIAAGAHADVHDLVFGTTGRRYLACDGGVYRNEPGVLSWVKSKNLPTTQCYHTTYNPNTPDVYFLGAQDNGIQKGNGQGINNWVSIFSADGFHCAFLPTTPDTFWIEIQNGNVYKTNDGGDSWQYGQPALGSNDRVNWDMPFFISKHRYDKLYGGTYRVYVSAVDGGWAPISGDLTDGIVFAPRFHTISAMSESPVLAEKLFVGTSDANVWRREPTGNFINITGNLPNRYVTAVQGSPTLPNRIFTTHSGYRDNEHIPHVHRSDNNGSSWVDISGNLPPVPVNDLFVLPNKADSVLFVATDAGVYYTLNAGQKWERLGSNMPVIPVFDLEHNPVRRELVAATFARGIWTFPLDSLYNNGQSVVGTVALGGTIKTDQNQPVAQVKVNTSTGNFVLSNANGAFSLNNQAGCTDQILRPYANKNWLNGVSTYDLVLISKHILGLDTLDTPYRMIAADANRSGSITTFDIVALRKLILGIDTTIQINTSWRFVPAIFSFPNALNPFETAIPDSILVSPQGTDQAGLHFVGLKVGDVNGSAIAGSTQVADTRTDQTWPLWMKDTLAAAGTVLEWDVWGDCTNLDGLQLTIAAEGNGMVIESVSMLNPDILDGHVYLDKSFRLCTEPAYWSNTPARGAQPLFRLKLRWLRGGALSDMLFLTDTPTPALAYRNDGTALLPVFKWGSPAPSIVSVLPNPMGADGAFLWCNTGTSTPYQCMIYDNAARLLTTLNGQTGAPLFLSGALFPQNGVYWCQVQLKTGQRFTQKVLVQRN